MFKVVLKNNRISRKTLIAIVFSVIMVGIAVYQTYSLVSQQMVTYFLKTFEKRSLAQLEEHHTQRVSITKFLFDQQFNSVKLLSKDKEIRDGLRGDKEKVKKILERQQVLDNHLETWTVFDKKGIVVLVVSGKPELASAVGKNFSNRDYFQKVMQTGKPYMSEMLEGVVTRSPFIDFSAPIFDENNEIAYVLNASSTLQYTEKHLNLTPPFSNISNLIIDWNGDLVFKNGSVVAPAVNLVTRDIFVRRLMLTKARMMDDEINFEGERVVEIGERVQFAENNKSTYYFVSYLPKKDFEKENEGLREEMRRVFFGITIGALFIVVISWILNIWLISLFISNKAVSTEWKNLIKHLFRF